MRRTIPHRTATWARGQQAHVHAPAISSAPMVQEEPLDQDKIPTEPAPPEDSPSESAPIPDPIPEVKVPEPEPEPDPIPEVKVSEPDPVPEVKVPESDDSGKKSGRKKK